MLCMRDFLLKKNMLASFVGKPNKTQPAVGCPRPALLPVASHHGPRLRGCADLPGARTDQRGTHHARAGRAASACASRRHGRVRQVPACARAAGSTPATGTDSVLGRPAPFLPSLSGVRPPAPLLPLLSTSLLLVLTFSACQAPVPLTTAFFPAAQTRPIQQLTTVKTCPH